MKYLPKSVLISKIALGGVALTVLCSFAASAQASERDFTFVYQSHVLEPGRAELEPWTTVGGGRQRYYRRIEQRFELELGVLRNLQTAVYWNWDSESTNVGGQRQTSSGVSSVSNTWKLKLSDPVANAIGSALYVEGYYGTTFNALEAKIIVDKSVGPWTFAGNLIGERAWNKEVSGPAVRELELAAVMGASYRLTPHLRAGLEVVQVNELVEQELETSRLSAGPVVSYAAERWWSAFTLQPQLAAFGGTASAGSRLDLAHGERLTARLVLGMPL